MAMAARPAARPHKEAASSGPSLRVLKGGARHGRVGASGRYRPSGVAFVAVGLGAVGAFVFGLVLINIYVAQSSFRMVNLQEQVARQEASYRRMRYEIARAESPARLAEEAERIGLVVPEHQEYIAGRELLPIVHRGPAKGSQEALKALMGKSS